MVMSGMRSDKLDRRIKILRAQKMRTNTGHESREFVELVRIWAGFVEVAPNEGVVLHKETMVQTYTWLIRYRYDINAEDQIEYDGQVYEIMGITEVQRKRFMKVKTVLLE